MISGQCLCGAHRFELEGKLELPHNCHCGYCRKQHGSAYASLVGIATEGLRWHRGDVISYPSPLLPQEHIWVAGAPAWNRITDDLRSSTDHRRDRDG